MRDQCFSAASILGKLSNELEGELRTLCREDVRDSFAFVLDFRDLSLFVSQACLPVVSCRKFITVTGYHVP